MSVARTGFFIAVMLSALGVSASDRTRRQHHFGFVCWRRQSPTSIGPSGRARLTCRALVQAYINRAKAYNGTCNQLVTEDMAPTYLPNYSEYQAAVDGHG